MSGPDERDPFAEGADARLAGADETTNPYDQNDDWDAHTMWMDGWNSIDDQEDE